MKRETNIGEQDGPFVGRASDLAKVDEALGAHRLVTITGPAGVGKTTLATRCAAAARGAYGGGAWLCDLSEAVTLDDVCRAVARVLEVPLVSAARGRSVVAQLGDALAGRDRVLVVLDNMEQIVEHAAETVGAWLAATEQARFLVTSRERLRVRGEVVVELLPLRVPPDGDEAAELFVERVRAGGGLAALSDGDAPTIAEIVRQLDGLPLAIELAAARIGVLSPAQLLAHLPRRLDLLGHGARDGYARQRTLRGAIAWSWGLLGPAERAALAQCSVFRGGFSLEAAEEVVSLGAGAPAVLDVLQALRDKSLLRTERAGDEARYGLYASIGEFAATMLEGEEAARAEARHAAHYARVAADWSARVSRAGGGAVMARFLLELDNVLAAIARSLDRAAGDPRAAAQALEALIAVEPVFSAHGSFTTFAALLDRAIDGPAAARAPAGLLCEARCVRGRVACAQGRMAEAERDLGQAAEIAAATGDRRREVRARTALGFVAAVLGRTADAEAQYARGLEHVDPADTAGLGDLLLKMGALELERGHLDAARSAYERALPLFVEAGDLRRTGGTMGNLAILQALAGHEEAARTSYLRAIESARDLGDLRWEAVGHANLALLLQEHGAFAEAHPRYERALTMFRGVGDRHYAGQFMLDWGTLFHEEGRLEDALTQYRRALAVMRESGYRRFEGLALAYITSVEAALGRGAGAEAGYAEAGYAEAERILAAADDQLGLVAVRLLRAYLDVLAGRATAGDARIKAARPLAAHRTDVRFCVRIVDRALRPRAPEGLRIGPEGRWFEASDVGRGGRADLAGRDALRAILLCLAAAHAERPGEPVTSAELLARGWPGERVLPRAGANRVRVALSTLRKLGLRTSLIGRPDGWLLDPALPVARVQR